MEKEEDKPYRMPDPQAITRSDTLLGLYELHMADFTTVDPDYDAAYATAWQAATNAFLDHPSHEFVQDHMVGYAESVDKTMARGSSAITALRYYAQQAFGANGLYRSFRFNANRHLRNRPADYAVYLRALHRTANVHLAALQAKGLTPAHMQELLDAADAILAAELDHEAYKSEVTHLAYQRTQLRNAMWAYPQKVNAAADVVFASDPIKRALFNLG